MIAPKVHYLPLSLAGLDPANVVSFATSEPFVFVGAVGGTDNGATTGLIVYPSLCDHPEFVVPMPLLSLGVPNYCPSGKFLTVNFDYSVVGVFVATESCLAPAITVGGALLFVSEITSYPSLYTLGPDKVAVLNLIAKDSLGNAASYRVLHRVNSLAEVSDAICAQTFPVGSLFNPVSLPNGWYR